MATMLAFRTPPGGVDIPVGQTQRLGFVDVHQFERIRLFAGVIVGGLGPVKVLIIAMEGNEAFGPLDELTVQPGSNVTKVYEVPGTRLEISATTTGAMKGSSKVIVLVNGFADSAR